jgi:ABC-type phosphate/phosphonate transport system substrate-binding protein
MAGVNGFKLGLPPSLGRDPSWALARELAALLDRAGFSMMVPHRTYEDLEAQLASGAVDVAWCPPIVCARMEAAGGAVLLRGVRGDERTYRSAIVIRAQDRFDLDTLARGTFRPRAAWVDRASVGGYLLARAHLRGLGLDLERAFLQQQMLGSYAACLDALLAYETDVSALFVRARGLPAEWGPRARRLKTLALTEEVPNDGVVLSPALPPDRAALLREKLARVLSIRALRAQLTAMFHVDDFDEPAPGTYAPVLKLYE